MNRDCSPFHSSLPRIALPRIAFLHIVLLRIALLHITLPRIALLYIALLFIALPHIALPRLPLNNAIGATSYKSKLLELLEKERKCFAGDYVPLSQKQLQAIERCSDLIATDRNSIQRNT